MLEGSRKYLREPIFVVFRYMRDANVVKIDLVFLVKRTTPHAQCQHGAADFAGAISKTSRSPVGRENPYTMVTTNPPIQSSRTSSCAIESNSRRNESHGSGMLSFGCVGKVFSLHVGQEIPVGRRGRAMLSQLGSSSRDRRYLRAQAGLSPKPPNTTGAFPPACSPSCPPTLRSPGRQQIPIGFAGHVPWRFEPTSPSPYQRRS